jgi:hypothetical protein
MVQTIYSDRESVQGEKWSETRSEIHKDSQKGRIAEEVRGVYGRLFRTPNVIIITLRDNW